MCTPSSTSGPIRSPPTPPSSSSRPTSRRQPLPGRADASDPLHRAAGEIESRIATAPSPSVVVRTSLIDHAEARDTLATAGLGGELTAVEVAPVRAEDVVELIVALDRARSRATAGHLLVRADGPARMSLNTYLTRIGATPTGAGLVGRRLVPEVETARLRSALAGGPWCSSGPELVDGWAFAGIVPAEPSA